MAINYNGDISVVLDTQHRTPGNLRAFVQATLRSIRTGKSSDVRFSSTEKIEPVPMITTKMEFSYKDGTILSSPTRKITRRSRSRRNRSGTTRNSSRGKRPVTVTLFMTGRVSIQLPSRVISERADAPEGVRGDSANNVQKAVTMEPASP